jgi:lipoprotein signal peptidase
MANSQRFNRFLLYALAVLGVAADQSTKYGVFAWLYEVPGHRFVLFRTTPEPEDELNGLALVSQFEYSDGPEREILHYDNGRPVPHVNHGALFGFLRDRKTLANLAFASISLLAAGAIIVWSVRGTATTDRWLCAALGLILAGTLGNLYDRLVFNGVRDFIHWDYFYNWPVFNVADCCLVRQTTGQGIDGRACGLLPRGRATDQREFRGRRRHPQLTPAACRAAEQLRSQGTRFPVRRELSVSSASSV